MRVPMRPLVLLAIGVLVAIAAVILLRDDGPSSPPAIVSPTTGVPAAPAPDSVRVPESLRTRVAELIDLPFTGHTRKSAKTTIAIAQVEPETTLDRLLAFDTSFPGDDAMRRDLLPRLAADRDFARVATEVRNVRVHAWVFAGKLEDDGDFSLVLGSEPGPSRILMTGELTGIPAWAAAATKDRLRAARRRFLEIVAAREIPGREHFTRYTPPIEVHIEGSLFYDVDHEPGTIGPGGKKSGLPSLRPATAWEIHPITAVE